MDTIVNFFHSIEIDFHLFGQAALIILVGMLALGTVGRFVFGKQSVFSCAVSSAIGILFIYALTVVLRSCGARFDHLVAPLPFVTISGGKLSLFSFAGAHYTAICAQLLSMIILAFLTNLVDGRMPKGKNVLGWIFCRCLTVLIAYLLHLIVVGLFTAFLPEGLVTYAPTVLLGVLVILLLTGALKILVGALIGTVSPLIGGLYTFFFATAIGKQVTRAVLTTALLAGTVALLNYVGITVISVASSALVAYVPLLIVLVVLWYLVNIFF